MKKETPRFSNRQLVKNKQGENRKKQAAFDKAFIEKRIQENKNLSDSQKRIIELVKSIS